MMKIVLLLLILLAGCHRRHYVHDETYFSRVSISEQKMKEYRLHVMRELWCQKQLRDYEEGQAITDRTKP